MKNFGATIDFTRQRNDDIMRVFRQKIAEKKHIARMPDLFKEIAESPSSRFWVSEERAAIVISAMEAGRKLPCMTDCKREMFTEIYTRYRHLRTLHPDKTIIELATIVVNQPAPKFYFTPRSIGEFIYRIRNGFYDRKYKRQI